MTGIYFIANDFCTDLTIAFLNSIRAVEPTRPLCLIPFNDQCQQVKSLASKYNFTVWDDDAALRRCDAISERFHPRTIGQYRKLCMWDGPFDKFVYIDIDTVLLTNLDKPISLLDKYDILTAIADLPNLRTFVWKDGIDSITSLDTAYSANTGFLASKRGVIRLSEIEQKIGDALVLKPYMALECTEQPLLNYLIVTSGRCYSSLLRIRRDEGLHDIPMAIWSGRLKNGNSPPSNTLLIHWAGEWQSGKHLGNSIWQHFRNLRDKSE